jgi:hypothetical protein
MKFYAKHVSVAEFDDQYFQVSFDRSLPAKTSLICQDRITPILSFSFSLRTMTAESATSRPMIMMPTQATSACSSLSSHLHASSSRSRGRKTSTSRWPMTWTRRSLVRCSASYKLYLGCKAEAPTSGRNGMSEIGGSPDAAEPPQNPGVVTEVDPTRTSLSRCSNCQSTLCEII